MIKVDLRGGDFFKEFPKEAGLEIVLQFKLGAAALERISPLESVQIEGDYLRVTNYLSEYRYKYQIKDLKYAAICLQGMM